MKISESKGVLTFVIRPPMAVSMFIYNINEKADLIRRFQGNPVVPAL